jgi:uncharacterized protein (DUF2236 family)
MADVVAEDVRTWLASELRSLVVGRHEHERRHARDVIDRSGPRWFPDDAPIRRVHADPAMFIGGLRAILLQSLHPLAMAGVADHSDFRRDPWGRLQRTASFLAATTYGTVDDAEAAVERVKRVHARVRGTAPDGRPYAADDPHLLRWVHVAELDSFLAANRCYATTPLEAHERDEYVADMAVIAAALGVPAPPMTVRAMRDQLRSFRRELRGTSDARQVARYLVFDPPLGITGRGPYAAIAGAAVGLLPLWARIPLRLPWMPMTEQLVVRPAGLAVTRVLGWAMSAPPSSARSS